MPQEAIKIYNLESKILRGCFFRLQELPPANSEQIADLADDLTAVVQCLVRNEGLVGAISAMQQDAISGIKEAIR